MKPGFNEQQIQLSHGSGGKAMSELIDDFFLKSFDNKWLNERNDQAQLAPLEGRLVLTTDSFVVSPLFFPGGDIGSLSIHGTVNDVAMAGAKPLYLSSAFIIEEGFSIEELKKIIASMAKAAQEAGVSIVTGDTKVVQHGKGDGVFITTTGLEVIPEGLHISVDQVRPGDKILINGFIGDHGVAVMSKRANVGFETEILSDSAALHDLVAKMVEAEPEIHCLRDPTRGGLAATLNEIASQTKLSMHLLESSIPVRTEVYSACELLGLDPLYVANEGKLVAFVPSDKAEKVLSAMKRHPLGIHSSIIGEVTGSSSHPMVEMTTAMGGLRVVQWLSGEQLPRIC